MQTPTFLQAPLQEMRQGLGQISTGLWHGTFSWDPRGPAREVWQGIGNFAEGAADAYVGYHRMLAEGAKDITRGVWVIEKPSSNPYHASPYYESATNYHPSTDYGTGPNYPLYMDHLRFLATLYPPWMFLLLLQNFWLFLFCGFSLRYRELLEIEKE